MSTPTQAALFALEQREQAKVEILQTFLDSPELAQLAPQLNAARQNLQSDPSRIYLLFGSVIGQSEELHRLHRTWHAKLAYLSDSNLTEYLTQEMLVKRQSDNAIAQLIFKILQKAKDIQDANS